MIKLELPRGDYRRYVITLKDTNDDYMELEDNQDLIFTIKSTFMSKEPLIQKSVSDGSIVYDDESHSYILILDNDDTKDLEYKEYAGDFKLVKETDSNPQPVTVSLIQLDITKEATNSTINYDEKY